MNLLSWTDLHKKNLQKRLVHHVRREAMVTERMDGQAAVALSLGVTKAKRSQATKRPNMVAPIS